MYSYLALGQVADFLLHDVHERIRSISWLEIRVNRSLNHGGRGIVLFGRLTCDGLGARSTLADLATLLLAGPLGECCFTHFNEFERKRSWLADLYVVMVVLDDLSSI